MQNSNGHIPTIDGPFDEAHRFIGRCLRVGMEVCTPIQPSASPTHLFSEAWAAGLGDAADATAVVEEDALTDEPTPDQAQAEAEVLWLIRDDDFWYWNVKVPKCFPGYRPTDDEDIKGCIRDIRERAASRIGHPRKPGRKVPRKIAAAVPEPDIARARA